MDPTEPQESRSASAPSPPPPLTPPIEPPVMGYAPPPQPDGAVEVIIPYKNVEALLAYYLGIFSVIPLLGILLGGAAFVLGIRGLRRRKRDPRVHGAVHAWIGIVVGGFFCALYLGLVGLSLVAWLSS